MDEWPKLPGNRRDVRAARARIVVALTLSLTPLNCFAQQKTTPASEYNLAIQLEQRRQLNQAIEHLMAAYRAHPDDVPVIEHLLLDLDVMRRDDEAQSLLDLLVASSSAATRKTVGTTLLEAGDYPGAAVLFESLMRQSPTSRETKRLLAFAYIGMQQSAKAIDLLKPEAGADPSGELDYVLGLAYEASGAIDDAQSAYKSAFRSDPRNGRAAFHLGMIASSRPGKLTQAVYYLRKAVSLEPGNPAYGIALGKCLLEQNNSSEALRALQQVHAEGPEAGERDLLEGIAAIVLRGPASATPLLERSVREDASLALSRNILGFCYLKQGRTAHAAAAYGSASDLQPQSRIFAHSAAVAFDRANDSDRATFYAKRGAALEDAGANDHLLLGRLLAKAGRPREAIPELNMTIAAKPDSPDAYFVLARSYAQVGDTREADLWAQKLKDLQKKTPNSGAATSVGATRLTSSGLLSGVEPAP